MCKFDQIDDKWAARLWGFGDAIVNRFAAHPAFVGVEKDVLVSYVGIEISNQLRIHGGSLLSHDESTAGWTGYTDYFVVNLSDVCAAVALATMDHFVLKSKHGSLPPSGVVTGKV